MPPYPILFLLRPSMGQSLNNDIDKVFAKLGVLFKARNSVSKPRGVLLQRATKTYYFLATLKENSSNGLEVLMLALFSYLKLKVL